MSRLRLIAGPNGSGKSSVFQIIKAFKESGKVIPTGPFINSDEIEKELATNGEIELAKFGITAAPSSIVADYLKISKLGGPYDPTILSELIDLSNNALKLRGGKSSPLLGMMISDLIREYLLIHGASFTMETVFSHPEKLNLMKRANELDYKVYLYFVSTESPDINIERIKGRVAAGGHDVPVEKIVQRYGRTMNNLYEAVKLSYRAYIFDNSGDETIPVAEKDKNGQIYLAESIPEWLQRYLKL